MTPATPASKSVTLWLFSVCGMIFIMAAIGAITRLTESGLSIVEWQVITGTLPPLSGVEWQEAFLKYQQIGEYSLQHAGMTLAEFKTIYWWEYIHRLWGRLIGLAFALPFVVFWLRGKLDAPLKKHGLIILALGAFQGWIGWWMVSSGVFQNIDDVAPQRLTIHLTLAFILFSYVLLLAFNRVLTPSSVAQQSRKIIYGLFGLTFLTIVWGALVAGHNAGLLYNTWPLMDGDLVPSGLFVMEPALSNLHDNPTTVQFIHRWLAQILAVLLIAFSVRELRRSPEKSYKVALIHVIVLTVIQVLIGIKVLMMGVPLVPAVLHQLGALGVLSTLIWVVSLSRKS